MKTRRGAWRCLVATVVVGIGISTSACHSATSSATDSPEASAEEDARPPADALVAADIHHVDVADIVRQAHARAVAENSHARLVYAVGFDAHGGLAGSG
jgi:hypothetical protein